MWIEPWRATIMRMSPYPAKSLLLLLPEAGNGGPVRGEQPKVRRYRLVRMRVNPPAAGDRLRRGQALADPFLQGEL
jgi:hypothetical protein